MKRMGFFCMTTIKSVPGQFFALPCLASFFGFGLSKCGSIAFGIAFTVNGFVTIIVSCFYLTDETRTKHSDLLWPVLIGFSVTYCILAIIEFWISKSFQSSVLVSLCIEDAVTSGLMLGWLSVRYFYINTLRCGIWTIQSPLYLQLLFVHAV